MRYRKRPVEVEAYQMTAERFDDNRDWPEWLNAAWNKESRQPGHFYRGAWLSGAPRMYIETTEGVNGVRPGDWIIRGTAGELYSCKPEIFAAVYDAVEEEKAAPAAGSWARLEALLEGLKTNGWRAGDFSAMHDVVAEQVDGSPFPVKRPGPGLTLKVRFEQSVMAGGESDG